MTLDRLLRPDLPEAQTLHYQHGVMVGWIPAIITKIEDGNVDPEGLGRIRVKCDLISPNKDLPNDFDGWVWVLEEFACNNQAGGAHRFLQGGSQVALLPMFGDPTKMLMLGAIHSRVDRPNPIFNRAAGTHGTQTPGQVFAIKDDAAAARTDAYPHGVTQQVTGKGDVIQQTKEKARLHLQADGTTRVENDKASSVVSAAGDIANRSAGNAIHILSESGNALMQSAFGSEVKLEGIVSHLSGPSSPISQAINGAKKHLGFLGKAGGLLKQVSQIAKSVNGGNLIDIAKTAEKLLGEVQGGLGANLAPGLGQLKLLQGLPLDHLAQSLMPQYAIALNLGLNVVMPQIEKALKSGDLKKLTEFMPQGALDKALPILKGLAHSLELQSQFVLDQHLKLKGLDGFGAIENLAGLGLHDKLGQIVEIASQPLPLDLSLSETGGVLIEGLTDQLTTQAQALTNRATEISDLLPPDIQQFVSPEKILALLKPGGADFNPENLVKEILKSTVQGFTNKSIDSLGALEPMMKDSEQIGQIVSEIAKGGDLQSIVRSALPELTKSFPQLKGVENLIKKPDALLQKVLGSIADKAAPAINNAMGDFNKLLQAAPKSLPGAIVKATQFSAELSSLFGTHKVFASEGGAGVKTPHGGFSFGKKGGLFEAVAPMLFKAAGINPAQLKIDGATGISLEGFAGGHSEGHPATRIRTVNGEIRLSTLNQTGAVLHEITIGQHGILIDGEDLNWLYGLRSQLQALELRLSVLEARDGAA